MAQKWQTEAEEADALLKTITGEPADTIPPAAATEGKKPDDENTLSGTPETETKAPETALPAGTEVTPEGKTDVWQQKYDVLKGKYDAEVPRYSQENVSLRNENTLLRQETYSLKDAVTEMQKVMAEGKNTPVSTADPEKVKAFRESNPDIAEYFEAERGTFEKTIGDFKKEIDVLKGKTGDIERSTVQTAQERYFTDLDGTVKDWRKLNIDSDFLLSLEDVEPYSGKKKIDLLKEAHIERNAQRVSKFFKDYIASKGTSGVDTAAELAAKREQHLHPDTTRTAVADIGNADKGKPAYVKSEVDAFYKKSKAEWIGREAEWLKLDKQYEEAAIDGRIVG